MIEQWFRSLKVENIYTNEYVTPRSLRQGISAYIEQYNTVRPHPVLGYKTPAQVYLDEVEGLETAC
ncbi:MAG: integrase core domain-containing protein [Eubacteriales bacterium]